MFIQFDNLNIYTEVTFMQIQKIALVLILLTFFVLPGWAEGEQNVKIISADRSNTSVAPAVTPPSDNTDITAIMFDVPKMMTSFNQFPFLNKLAVAGIAVAVVGSLVIVVIAIFAGLGKIGLGSMHYDPKKGWKMIEHNKAAVIVLFFSVMGTFLICAAVLFFYRHGFTFFG
jgi:hypothetical protein